MAGGGRSLQTFRSAGAGRREADGCYKLPLRWSGKARDRQLLKHSAPLEREGARPTVVTNVPLRWSGKARGRQSLQTFRSAGAGKREADGCYKHAAPLERESARPTVPTN